MERKPRDPKQEPKSKSLLAPIILTTSAIVHCALIGYAALLPAEPEPAAKTARVQVQVYEHTDAQDTWAALGTRWALVSRDKLTP